MGPEDNRDPGDQWRGPGELAGDLGAQYAIGVNNAIKGLTDLMGPGNPLSVFLSNNAEWYRTFFSAGALRNEKEVSRILSEAHDKGVLDQLVLGAKAFGAAPADILAGATGSLSTFAVGGAAGRAVGLGARGIAAAQAAIGAGMQAGVVKNEIYEGVKGELIAAGKSDKEAEEAARRAQGYLGKNLDQILIGAGLGAVDGLTGAERIIGRALTRGGLGAGASRVASVMANGLTEGGTEGLQGGHEKFAVGVAAERDGLDGGGGIFASAAVEGIAGGILGGGAAAVETRVREAGAGRTGITTETRNGMRPSQEQANEPPVAPKGNKTAATPATGGATIAGSEEKRAVPGTTPNTGSETGKGQNEKSSGGTIPTLSPGKARVLGVEKDAAGAYLAATYPELGSGASTPAQFAEKLSAWRVKIEKDIGDGKYLNKGVWTGDFVREYGYEPAPSQKREMLEDFRRRQQGVQDGWVRYLKEGGYSDSVSCAILSSITKETASRKGGNWEFHKLGGTSNRMAPEVDPEIAAEFSQNFRGDRRPSQALAEAGIAVTKRAAESSGRQRTLQSDPGALSWIKIPSKDSQPEHFEENTKRLTNLSRTVEEFGCCKWCTAHGKAADYLSGGDFWVGTDSDGLARIGIRLERGQIQEIRGVLHSQAIEPGLAPQLTKLVEEEKLDGGELWVRDAELKGKVAALGGDHTWADLKGAIGKENDEEAAEFIHSYRGPSGRYDFLVGADNNNVHRLAWEHLSRKPLTQLNLCARAGSFSQARGWVTGDILDTTRPDELGGGRAMHGLFSDNEGMAGKAPHLLREWGLLTPERQRFVDGDGNNILHLQAGGRGQGNLGRHVGGPEKSDLMPFLNWGGVDRAALFQPNGEGKAPIGIFLERHAEHVRRQGGGDPEKAKTEMVEAYQRHGGRTELLGDGGGAYREPLVFSAAKGRLLSQMIGAGVVSPDDISSVRNKSGDTAWHAAELDDLRNLAAAGHLRAEHLGIKGAGDVTVGERICGKPGGFGLLLDSGLITRENAGDMVGSLPSLAHAAAAAGDGERALSSGIFDRETLIQGQARNGNNFLHDWGSMGTRSTDHLQTRKQVLATGLVPEDFEKTNSKGESGYGFFAERPGGMMLLSQAGLVTRAGLGYQGGVWLDNPLHKLPPHSSDAIHHLAETGVLSRGPMVAENSRRQVPLQNFVKDEFNGGDGLDGVKRLAGRIGLGSEDFTEQHGDDGRDCLDVARELRRDGGSPYTDPLPEFLRAGIIDPETAFRQRHPETDPEAWKGRTDTQRELARRAWGRSPFEDSVLRGGAETFKALCDDGFVTADRMRENLDPRSQWTNYAEFILATAGDDPSWQGPLSDAIDNGLIDRGALTAERRQKGGPVFLGLGDSGGINPVFLCLRKGILSPGDLTAEAKGGDSILSRMCTGGSGALRTLIEVGGVEAGSLSKITIPRVTDGGNPGRYLIEKDPDTFFMAAAGGQISKADATFGRRDFDGPLEYAMYTGKLNEMRQAGVLGPWMLDHKAEMRRAWTCAAEEGVVRDLVTGISDGGATGDQLRRSFLEVGEDGKSALSALRARGAADALLAFSDRGLLNRGDLSTPQGNSAVKSILEHCPSDLRKLAEAGLVGAGYLYSGEPGKGGMFRSALAMTRNADEERSLVKGVVDSGMVSPEERHLMARDLCGRRGGSAGLREAVASGVISGRDLALQGDDGKCALDLLLGRASVTAERRQDLSFLLDNRLVPAEYRSRFERGAEGKFSAVGDALDRIAGGIAKLVGARKDEGPRPISRGAGHGARAAARAGATMVD